MAIRYRQGRASPWQCYWNNPFTGKRESESFLTEEDAKKHDSLIKHRLRFERESFKSEDVEQGESVVLTLEACYLQYLKQKKFNKKALEWQIDAMRMPLQKRGSSPIGGIKYEHIVGIMEDMQKQAVKPVTVRGRLSVFRTVLRWCADNGFCDQIRFPKLPPAHYEKFIPPTPEELSAIMDVAAPHIVRVIVLGAQCGVRVGPSEMLRLTWDDVDIVRRILRVHGAKKNLAAPWREVPIREILVPVFESWRKEDAAIGAIHLINYKGRTLSSIKTAWRHALVRAGITRRIRPYDLRHAFATDLIAGGVDVGTVSKLMGHSSPAMILNHYQYVMDRQKRAAVEALPDIGGCAQPHVPKRKSTYRRTVSA